MPNLLIAGCGYVGCALATSLAATTWRVFGLRRDTSRLAAFKTVVPVAADMASTNLPAQLAPLQHNAIDAVVFCQAASSRDAAGYQLAYVTCVQNLLKALRAQGQHAIKTIIFTSSTAVYPQNNGSWVDESSPVVTDVHDFRGAIMLEAEQSLQYDAQAHNIQLYILRFGGIYGPGRRYFLDKLIDAIQHRTYTPPSIKHYVNRIHVDDCAGSIMHMLLLQHHVSKMIVNATDGNPCDQYDIAVKIAAMLKKSIPPATYDKLLATGKRCSNVGLLTTGYKMQHPQLALDT